MVAKELNNNFLSGKSHGEAIFQKYGFSGARGEAESGFELVFGYGLPQLSGLTVLNDNALIKCFLAIASKNNDTNILYRRGPEVLSAFQELCKEAAENFNEARYAKVIEFCKNENISPGGSADLLALSIFVRLVIDANRKEDKIDSK